MEAGRRSVSGIEGAEQRARGSLRMGERGRQIWGWLLGRVSGCFPGGKGGVGYIDDLPSLLADCRKVSFVGELLPQPEDRPVVGLVDMGSMQGASAGGVVLFDAVPVGGTAPNLVVEG